MNFIDLTIEITEPPLGTKPNRIADGGFDSLICSARADKGETKIMSNMSYARFENTYSDLQDCYEAMDDELSETEQNYRTKLIKLCSIITEQCQDLLVSDEVSD
jgi:hypothetical protein